MCVSVCERECVCVCERECVCVCVRDQRDQYEPRLLI